MGRWVWPADELLILAGEEVPPPGFYRGCGLEENGIGLLSGLLDRPPAPSGSGTVVTGALAAPYIADLLRDTGYGVLEVENRFLGRMVGVAGLLSGADVAEAVRRRRAAGHTGPFFLPAVMFNRDGLTLDDMTVGEMSAAAGTAFRVAASLRRLP
jgi:NifB/MoaA-like Fe-S oxidoreductase